MSTNLRDWSQVKVLLALVLVLGFAAYLYSSYIYSEIQPDRRYPTDYAMGGVYRTKLALTGVKTYRVPFFTLRVVLFYGSSTGRELFGHKPLHIPAGTHVRVERLVLTRAAEGVRKVMVEGRFLDGALAGHRAGLEHISRQEFRRGLVADLLSVDPAAVDLVADY